MNRSSAIAFILIALFALLALTSCSPETADGTGSLCGRVLLEESDSAGGILVTLRANDDPDEIAYSCRTEENGTFKFQDIRSTTYTVSFIISGYNTVRLENIKVRSGRNTGIETTTLSIQLGTIKGTVQDSSGNPLSGATVTVSGNGRSYSTTTGSDGSFSMSVRAGKYTDIVIGCYHHNLKGTLNTTVRSGSDTKLQTYKIAEGCNYEVIEKKDATSTEPGYKKYRCTDCGAGKTEEIPVVALARWAGVRVSSYGMEESFGSFPGVTAMTEFGAKMESCYEGSTGAYVFIVGTVDEDIWTCHLGFPLSKEIENVYGEEEDLYEEYLTAFDEAGYSVWLQVEPGNANLADLADEVMNRYKHHSCVKGFGIDVEWYKPEGTRGRGTKLTDSKTVNTILSTVKGINSDYTVFVKHWDERWLPDAQSGLIFVNDSQGFYGDLEKVCDDFADWAEHFDPCPVMFQIGYDADEDIWGTMTNPAKDLGTAIIEECNEKERSNDIGIIWVDFTLKEAMEKIQPNE